MRAQLEKRHATVLARYRQRFPHREPPPKPTDLQALATYLSKLVHEINGRKAWPAVPLDEHGNMKAPE